MSFRGSISTENATEYTRTDIVRWWEQRRLHFNLYVGVIGIVSWLLVLVAGSATVKRGADFEEPLAMLFVPVLYAIAANIGYTGGWIVDTLAFQGGPRVGLYKAGVVFSIVLTALPGVWCVVTWLMTLITGHKLD
jgi:hypothetical protein